MRDIVDDEFDYAAHRVVGSAPEARGWIDRSALSEQAKRALHRLVDRFPTVNFYRDDAALLDHLERRNEVVLPRWLRAARQTLAGLGPDVEVRFDDFDHLGPRSDHVSADDDFIDLWYGDRFFGYTQEEERSLFLDDAGCYPILCATTGVLDVLAANLLDHDDERVFDFCDEDIMDNQYEGKSGTASVYPAFDSYPRMLSRIVECRTPDGTVTRARGLDVRPAGEQPPRD